MFSGGLLRELLGLLRAVGPSGMDGIQTSARLGDPRNHREAGQGYVGINQVFPFPLRSLLEQLKKLQAIVVQSTSKSAQTGTCIAVSPDPQLQGACQPWQRVLWGR